MAEEHEEKKTHEVKDKRRVNPDGTLREEAVAEAAEQARSDEPRTPEKPPDSEPAPEQDAGASGEQAETPPPNVYAMLQFVFGLMAEQAWQLMGLRLAPGQKEPFKDMAQAKVAIDTAVFISDKLHPHVSDEDHRALRAVISDLQMNYVSRSS